MSLNGQNTTLVQDARTGWHAEADNGEKVKYDTGTTNGTIDGGYWVITTTDGTPYYFGLNELPGYASGDPATNSTWTEPVYATSSGQACYNATFASSKCAQAWRWNLDYVTDPHGNAVAYFYNTETNYYAERQRHHRERRLHPGRGADEDRVRAARRGGLRLHPGRRGQLHRRHQPHDTPSTWPAPPARRATSTPRRSGTSTS